jgi:RNAse (barnase) inhibitor barstar
MKTIELDFKELYTPRQIHEYIAQKLGFPEYYGKNLDALYDCLTDISEETEITIVNYDVLDYRENAIINTFLDAVEDLSYEHLFYEKHPDEQKTDFEAEVNGYSIKMVKEEYELEVYKSAYLIGVNEKDQKICYLFYYDFDMDVLEDLDSYIDEHFYLK